MVLLDGGMGRELLNRGVPQEAGLWSATSVAREQPPETKRRDGRDTGRNGERSESGDSLCLGIESRWRANGQKHCARSCGLWYLSTNLAESIREREVGLGPAQVPPRSSAAASGFPESRQSGADDQQLCLPVPLLSKMGRDQTWLWPLVTSCNAPRFAATVWIGPDGLVHMRPTYYQAAFESGWEEKLLEHTAHAVRLCQEAVRQFCAEDGVPREEAPAQHVGFQVCFVFWDDSAV